MNTQTQNNQTRFFFPVACIYLITVALSVAYSWIIGVHRFDLSLTVSLYVGLHIWTSVFYFLGASVVCFLLTRYVMKTDMRSSQRITYLAILLCVFGCAWFPCNGDRSPIVEDIHNWFSYALVFLLALSFGLMTLFSRTREKRVFGFCSFLFSVFFILSYALGFSGFKNTVFIWENVLIALLFFALLPEKKISP